MFKQFSVVAFCVLIVPAKNRQESLREIVQTLRVDNGGMFGDWGHFEYCADGRYAIGYDMKISNGNAIPDVGSIGVESRSIQQLGSGDFGLRYLKDDTSANYVTFMCRDYTEGPSYELAKPPGNGRFGNWGSLSGTCPPYSAVCGISTKVEGHVGIGDDTSLNDVLLHCCTEGRVASEHFGK